MLRTDDIVRSVQRHWDVEFSGGATLYPGQQADVSALDEWTELTVEVWREEVRRDVSPDELLVAATVHCFGRHPQRPGRARLLADAARDALHRQLIAIHDFMTSDLEEIGVVRTREAELRDLTRVHAAETRGWLQHLVVTVMGTAAEVE